MSCTSNENTVKEFGSIMKKLPQIFDEILVKLGTEHDLRRPDILQLKRDVLFSILLVIMIENGFQVKVSDGTVVEDLFIDKEYKEKFRLSSGLYEAEFVMFGLNEISVKLVLIPLDSIALVNLVINEIDSETYSLCLPVDSYVILNKHETKSANLFCNLLELINTFKDKVVTPVKSKLLTFCGYPSASLAGIPEDLFLKIMIKLPVSDIVNTCKTCKKFKVILENDGFWHRLYIRDFDTSVNIPEVTWRFLYEKQYRKLINLKKRRRYPPLRVSSFFDWAFLTL